MRAQNEAKEHFHRCPNCIKPIARGNVVCSSCGRQLITLCPFCGGQTFAGSERCDACGHSLMVQCENKRCGELQYFENAKCTVCGKPLKKAAKQLEKMKKGVM